MTAVVAFLVVALVVAVALIVWLYAHTLRHKYTDDDLRNVREDSKKRSRSVVSGQVQEAFAPFFPELISEFNPRDARFLGSPLDFIIFDGLDDADVRRVVFVEIKRGKASLNPRERQCRDAILEGRVEYRTLRFPGDSPSSAAPGDAESLAADA